MDLFALLINQGVGVYSIGLAFGIFSSVLSVPAQMFPGLFFLSIRAWVFTLYRSRLPTTSKGFSLLYDTVLHKCSLVCSSYQSGQGCLLYYRSHLPSTSKGIFSSLRHGPAHMFPGLFFLPIRAWVFTLYRSRLPPTSEGFSLLYDAVLHKSSLVFSSYQSGRGCLLCTVSPSTYRRGICSSYEAVLHR